MPKQDNESAIRAKLRLKEVLGTDRELSKDDLNKNPIHPKRDRVITKSLMLDSFPSEEGVNPKGIIRLDKEPEDKL